MKAHLLVFIACMSFLEYISAQGGDGVVAFELPVRNSLTFNRNIINPTFSFVREQNKFVSAYNKREWVQFNDAPLSYLVSYSGRFTDNIGAGITLFQQNYGVLTTYGGVINFAYNARLERDTNLTFGLNLAAYSSGLNSGDVVTNFPDPSLDNIESNFLVSVNPGINFGTTFLDFGVSVKNLFLYNVQSSELLQDVPNQGLQGHVMYTGYMSSRGFFDDSKFTGLLRSEFRKDETIIAANAMLSIPKGFWVQGGYNTMYGASGGIGLNITEEIAIEYNYEMALGDFSDFGPSHEITLAYRFKNERFFDYSSQDEVTALIAPKKYKKPSYPRYTSVKRKAKEPVIAKTNEGQAEIEAIEAKRLADEKARLEAEQLAQAELKAKEDAERLAQQQAELDAKRLAEEKAKREAELLAKKQAENKAKLLAELKAKEAAERKARLEADRLAKEQEAIEAKRLAEEQAKIEAERLAKEQEAIEAQKIAEQKSKEEKEFELITNPDDDLGKSMQNLVKQTEQEKEQQQDLLDQYKKAVDGKNENLKNLKEENDLSEQGIAVKPKPFKSITKENEALKAIKADLDEVIDSRSIKINELEELYDDLKEADTIVNDVVMLYYKREIKRLKSEQIETDELKAKLESRLKDIQLAIEFEKRRRIKRAEFDNEEERYKQDRATLTNLKQTTSISDLPLKEDDFDFGIPQPSNIQILKNINYVDSGFYAVLAVHSDVDKRNEFITKSLKSGLSNVEFFYDVNTSKYYIYSKKFGSVQEANNNLKLKGTKPYNSNMSIIKIEN
ncbi:PorP/SprF family type IX secretion system membrane protein [uncultured Winogradskyella sp.]|uniref:PorP/SprF family type IX secretion system membrane protein n=1 Tax=uncultured Winogradskyella sp. TaxID=395353 RepID=UPI002633CC6C|nr:PorP/SprF family type IX secretion system membrane protein [uncultured Winogradskyella sp.]